MIYSSHMATESSLLPSSQLGRTEGPFRTCPGGADACGLFHMQGALVLENLFLGGCSSPLSHGEHGLGWLCCLRWSLELQECCKLLDFQESGSGTQDKQSRLSLSLSTQQGTGWGAVTQRATWTKNTQKQLLKTSTPEIKLNGAWTCVPSA